MELEDALAAATTGPAKLLPTGKGYGQLRVGMPADLAIFELEQGQTQYDDFFGDKIVAKQRLRHILTMKDGIALTAQPSPAMDYKYLRR
jgi:dihydroorotase